MSSSLLRRAAWIAARFGQCEAAVAIEGEPIRARWDRMRIEQLLTNLLTNAMKYGRGKPIAVSVGREGARVRIAVRDQGIGIAEADHQRIFGRFERAATGRVGGLGLGLYIAREIARAHGGDIRVESRLGEGATFTVSLPGEPPAREA